MNGYILTDHCGSPWIFELRPFMTALQHQWPNAILEQPAHERWGACIWSLFLVDRDEKRDDELVEGFLTQSRDHIGVTSSPQGCVEFASWLKSQLPTSVKVYIGDDQHPDVLEVTDKQSEPVLIGYFTET